MPTATVEQWCTQELTSLLGDEAPIDFVHYILDIDEEEELTGYIEDLVGTRDDRTRAFVKTLLNRKKSVNSPEGVTMYKKEEEAVTEMLQAVRPKQRQRNNKAQKAVSKKVDLARLHKTTPGPYEASIPAELPLQNGGTTAPAKVSPKRTKTKFVSLYSAEGEARSTIQLTGRHCCECQAHTHKLVANCLTCGRVVCAQEGSGPCLFCGELVCTKAESEVLARRSKTSEKLRKKLMEGRDDVHPEKIGQRPHREERPGPARMDDSLKKAIEHKDRLLENDKSSLGRLVIDDQSDYFSTDTNQWLSTTDRDILQERKDELREDKYGPRRHKKVTLDFAGRRVIEEGETTSMYDVNDDAVQAVHYGKGKSEGGANLGPVGDLVNPDITRAPPQFSLSRTQEHASKNTSLRLPAASSQEKNRAGVRIQDQELLKMSDEGWCLSMHQPWATLLIEGIKKHEGRTWYTPHRGRLWIAAGAKKPTEEEIGAVEDSHRYISGNENVQFPPQYPTSCVLGCVDMVDCLAQEQYREKFPDGESNSEYVFIVESPQELILRFPIKGRHKLSDLRTFLSVSGLVQRSVLSLVLHDGPCGRNVITKCHYSDGRLESEIHKAAKKGLRRPHQH